ncbi:hypothetical protein L7F22_021764 [Adiantum nelumboides]|nr:hypothetical protein [Adiantum nelumboides]
MTVDQSCYTIVPSRHVNTNSWKLPDTPSDLIVKVGCISYALHKAPLVSRSGLFKMLIAEGTKEEASKVDLDGIPGGAEGFELAAKFCYGMMPELTKHNVTLLRCVAEFLDMSEDKDQVPNLISVTEDYLDRVMSKHSFKDIVTVLHISESLLPLADDIGIVSQCVGCIVSMVMHNDRRYHVEEGQNTLITFQEFQHNMNNNIDWWVEELSTLGMNFYQKVLASMKKAGLKPEAIGHALIYYAHKSLKILTKKSSSLTPLDHGSIKSKVMAHDASVAVEHEERILVETIVSLLPTEKNIASTNFLIGMLRIAHILETTLACRLDLEKRIASQLHKATLDDLLMPSHSKNSGESLFDVDTVHHLVASFIEQQRDHDEYDDDDEDDTSGDGLDDTHNGIDSTLASQSPLVKVGKLVDGYLAEISADFNLPPSKFIALAELLPAQARPQSDGLYRAIDIFMKIHTGMTDVERKKICRLIDFQKLTAEACTHAAQNERLPVQAVVQVLYFEQMRIRNVMAGSHFPHVDEHPSPQGHHHPRHSPHGQSPHAHRIPSFHSPENAHFPDGHRNGIHNAPFADGHHNSSHRAHPFGAYPNAHHPFSNHKESPQEPAPTFVHKISNGNLCAALSPHDQYASVRIENRELKQEVARMKMRLNDLEKGHVHPKHEMPEEREQPHYHQQQHHRSQNHSGQQEEHRPHNVPPPQQHHGGFFHAFSKSLSKLNPFHHHKLAPAPTPPPPQPSAKRRPRSISINHEQAKGREANKQTRRHSAST